ncbi:hypothetical protein XENORESO_014510, partial [Xenotaenia resolanae]
PWRDCQHVLDSGETTSGIYLLRLQNANRLLQAWCEQSQAQGGWTVIQRRQDGSVNFFMTWEQYKQGFGNLNGEYWLGLEHLYWLTQQAKYKLRVFLEDWQGRQVFAEYDSFHLEPENDWYRLRLGQYHGNAGDSLSWHNNKAFTTLDRDKDSNCAHFQKGGWWYHMCAHSNLNGVWYRGGHYRSRYQDGVYWAEFHGGSYSLKRVNSSSTYTCTATNILGNITVQVYVVVEEMTTTGPAAVSNPEEKALENCGLTLMPSEVYVKYGDPASINCSTASRDVAKMSWEFSVGSTSETPPTVTWMVEKLKDFAAKPFCFVTLNDDNSVAVSAVGNGSMREGEKHQLECVIHTVTPANKLLVKWYKDNENVLSDDKKNLSWSPPGSLKNLYSFYTFTAKKSDNGSLFRCEAEFQFGPAGPLVPPSMASKPYTAHVHYSPEFTEPDTTVGFTADHNVTLVCNADGNPEPEIKWTHYQPADNVRETTVGRQKIITITRATSTNAGHYIC